jgi:hypothetical protein
VWNGIDVGGKMAVVKLNDGSLWVHSPVELDTALAAELAQARRYLPFAAICTRRMSTDRSCAVRDAATNTSHRRGPVLRRSVQW